MEALTIMPNFTVRANAWRLMIIIMLVINSSNVFSIYYMPSMIVYAFKLLNSQKNP